MKYFSRKRCRELFGLDAGSCGKSTSRLNEATYSVGRSGKYESRGLIQVKKTISPWGWIFIFAAIYVYAAVAMYSMRVAILPLVTQHVSEGSLGGDPQYYQSIALSLAEKIRANGLGVWELRPEGQGPAGVVALVYMHTKSQIAIVLINAVLHSLAALALIEILRRWFSLSISIFATLPFIVSPYQMHWFSQINKDSYVACGVMLYMLGALYAVSILNAGFTKKSVGLCVLFLFGGAFVTSVGRPFIVLLLSLVVVLVSAFYAIKIISNRDRLADGGGLSLRLAFIVVLVVLLFPFMHGATSDGTIGGFVEKYESSSKNSPKKLDENLINYPIAAECLYRVSNQWRDSDVIPVYAESRIRALLSQRCLYFIQLYDSNQVTRLSVLDQDFEPTSAWDAVMYFPRAVQIGLFAPFPSQWLGKNSTFYVFSSIEMSLFYVCFPCLIFWMFSNNLAALIGVPIVLCLGVLAVYGVAVPYVGALYRYRYPFMMILLSLSIAAALETTGILKKATRNKLA